MKRTLCLCLAALVIGAFGLLAQSGSDDVYKRANEAFQEAYYQQAYGLYQQARKDFLTEGNHEKADACRIRMYKVERILAEYTYTKKQAVKILAETFQNVSEAERNTWLENGKADFRVINGKPRYFSGFVSNLMYRDPDLLRKNSQAVDGELTFFRKYHGMIFKSSGEGYPPDWWNPYINPVTFLGSGTLTVRRDKFPDKGLLKVWIPLPVLTGPQDSVRIISITPKKYVRTVARTDSDLGSVYLAIPLS